MRCGMFRIALCINHRSYELERWGFHWAVNSACFTIGKQRPLHQQRRVLERERADKVLPHRDLEVQFYRALLCRSYRDQYQQCLYQSVPCAAWFFRGCHRYRQRSEMVHPQSVCPDPEQCHLPELLLWPRLPRQHEVQRV